MEINTFKEKENLCKIINYNRKKEKKKINFIWKSHVIGHEGFEKTYERELRRSFFIEKKKKGMTVDI